MPFAAAGNVIGGYKAALNNDNVSEEAVRLHEAQLAYIATSASILTLQRYFAYLYIEKGGRAEDRGDQELWRRHVRRLQASRFLLGYYHSTDVVVPIQMCQVG